MEDSNGISPEDRVLKVPPTGLRRGNGSWLQGHAQSPFHRLTDDLHARDMPVDEFAADSETPSDEDYDESVKPTLASSKNPVRTHQPRRRQAAAATASSHSQLQLDPGSRTHKSASSTGSNAHIFTDDDKGIQDLLHKTSQLAKDPRAVRKPAKFSGLVFTHRLTAFDPHNAAAANSPFAGFYTLFWLSVALFVFKISAKNWHQYGNPLGSNEIMKTMFSRDVIVLLLSDGVMCALTGFSWILQLLVLRGYLKWDRSGWIIQNIWQSFFIAGVVVWTLIRDWPWTHTVFFVLHGLVMLMKQHSYSFYNGHLSTVYEQRIFLLTKLKQLDLIDPANSPSPTDPPASAINTSHLAIPPSAAQRRLSLSQIPTAEETDIDRIARAIASREPLDDEQISLFSRIIKWEVDALADELRGTASDVSRAYPNNLTFLGHYRWIPLPTVVYELEYPRSESIKWLYVIEKLIAMVGILFVMIQVSQYYMYPVVMKTVEMKEQGVPLVARFKEFPWLLSDLIFPFMMEYLLVWYLIWETILNILAELTFFADRSFYGAWWNSVSWDQFARDWNRPVHVFLLRHVYHSSISFMRVNKYTATLITFFLSACVHELVMWCLFKKLRGYLLILQMCQLPLVRLSRTQWLKDRKTLGNFLFWLGLFTGPSLLCSLYLIL